ncbi:MAG TPA: vitamin B12-dependent ribonucleotide reductase [Dehalococcoidia bacterium]|nr:vitamin B12-dependent ribonucleotide reductase [Dehalococcoidia bacterium]
MVIETKPSVRATVSSTAFTIERFFTRSGDDPFDDIAWERRTAVIADESGTSFFEQKDVEIPAAWSQTATNVVVSKYFRGQLGTERREKSVRQMIGRVAKTITAWGEQDGYFESGEEARTFHDELTHLLVHQKMAFNSPVWFNVGVEEKPQCSACFILSVEDTMESILEWCKTEGMIFKGGSGSGINLSPIRSSREQLSAGGQASGPISFMRGADSIAGSIKSGGKTRRAAKMVVLNADHPDVEEFIDCKVNEERKAYALGAAGWDMSLNGDAWSSIQFQNANNSIRVTDEFMRAAVEGRDWTLVGVVDGQPHRTVGARDLLNRMAAAAWECGDPGMQYDTTINAWHTCANTARINASNPCSEYMHVDNSACNLASLNLMRFVDDNGVFDVESFRRAVAVTIWAQEIIVGNSSYPTAKIAANTMAMRQLGLGYANLGALLMSLGLPYDSDAGRAYAAAITALMTGHAYATSASIAKRVGPFEAFHVNRDPMLRVVAKHRDASRTIDVAHVPTDLIDAAQRAWDDALELGQKFGYRNAQATVLAPTGTIAFMMDCDTTGVEPDIALVKYKKLVGGGMIKIVNQTVPRALKRLGYTQDAIESIIRHIDDGGTIEGAAALRDEHLPVFDCAFKAENGQRSIHHMGHIKMMGATQPFISGAISKTVNLPNEATIEDVADTYIEAWRHGVKAIAIYRDGSKKVQPLSTSRDAAEDADAAGGKPVRRKMSDTRSSVTHKFSIEGHDGYITVGLYDDGTPGEIFLSMAKQGSTVSGLMEAFGRAVSYALQYGVPLQDLVRNFSHMRFEPMGRTENRDIPVAQSIIDYVFRWLASRYMSPQEAYEVGVMTPEIKAALAAGQYPLPLQGSVAPIAGGSAGDTAAELSSGASSVPAAYRAPRANGHADAPACASCGWIMIRSGTCYRCENCGSTSGCS